MRLVATLIIALASTTALAACAAKKPTGPAWPEPSKTAEDGGESIEPRSTAVAASVEKSADDAPKAAAPAEEAAKPAAAAPEAETPATLSPSTQPKDEEVIMSEEIIIEIED